MCRGTETQHFFPLTHAKPNSTFFDNVQSSLYLSQCADMILQTFLTLRNPSIASSDAVNNVCFKFIQDYNPNRRDAVLGFRAAQDVVLGFRAAQDAVLGFRAAQ